MKISKANGSASAAGFFGPTTCKDISLLIFFGVLSGAGNRDGS